MKVFSLFILLAGWFLVVTAIAWLKPGFIPVFVIAGIAVEVLGLVFLARQNLLETVKSTRSQEPRY